MKVLKTVTGQFNFPAFPRAVWAIAAGNIIGGIGWSSSFLYLSLYLYQERLMPMTLVGVLMLISGVSSGICQVAAGVAGDRWGHRRVAFLFAASGAAVSAALAGLIAMEAPLWSVIVAAILAPTLGGSAHPSLNAIIIRASPRERLTESYSLQAIAGNISWSIGPLLGGFLLGFAPFGWIFGIGAAFSALSLLPFLFLPADTETGRPDPGKRRRLRDLVPGQAVIVFSLMSVLFYLTMTQWGSTLSVFTVDRIGFTAQQYGLLMSISGVMIIAFQYPISRRVALIPRTALILGCLFYGVGFLSLAWIKAFVPAIASIAVMVTGEMLFVPSAMGIVGVLAGEGDKGKSMGFFGLCSTLGFSLGPVYGGFLLDKFPTTPLLLWGPISMCSFAAALGFAAWRGYASVPPARAGG
jgi:MFS family permease